MTGIQRGNQQERENRIDKKRLQNSIGETDVIPDRDVSIVEFPGILATKAERTLTEALEGS